MSLLFTNIYKIFYTSSSLILHKCTFQEKCVVITSVHTEVSLLKVTLKIMHLQTFLCFDPGLELFHKWNVCGGFFHTGEICDSNAFALKTRTVFLLSSCVSPKPSVLFFSPQLRLVPQAVTGIITSQLHTQ